MTVSAQSRVAAHAGDGSNSVFAYGFKILDASDLSVVRRAVDGSETVLILGTDYSVTGAGDEAGGAVTFTVVPAVGEMVFLIGVTPLTSTLDLEQAGPFPSSALEGAVDKLTRIAQEQDALAARATKVPLGESAPDLPDQTTRAGKVLAFSSDGSAFTTGGTLQGLATVEGLSNEIATLAGLASEIGSLDANLPNILNYNGRGGWATATAYAVKDFVRESGKLYLCEGGHISGTFATDLTAGRWTQIAGVDMTDDTLGGGASLVGYQGHDVARALTAAQPIGLAGYVAQRAKTGVVRLVLDGTSIANFSDSALRHLTASLYAAFGDAKNRTYPARSEFPIGTGVDRMPSGSGEFKTVRIGPTAPTRTIFRGLAKRITIRYETQADGGSCTIKTVAADGTETTEGTLDCSGAQSYSNEFNIVKSAIGYHALVIEPPASGYIYIENITVASDLPGVEILDLTRGGHGLRHRLALKDPDAGEIAGIAIVGNNGVDSVYGNTGTYTRGDVYLTDHLVNDVAATASFATGHARAVAQARANGSQLLWFAQLGGINTPPAAGNHGNYEANRRAILAANGSPAYHAFDLQGLAIPDNPTETEVEQYADEFYGATIVAHSPLNWSGETIHGNGNFSALWSEVLHKAFGIPPIGRQGDGIGALTRRQEVTPWPGVGVSLGDRKWLDYVGVAQPYTNTIGRGNRQAFQIGKSFCPLTGLSQPLWLCPDEEDFGTARDVWPQRVIEASPTGTDEYGPYYDWSAVTNFDGISLPFTATNAAQIFTVTALVGGGSSPPGSPQFRFKASAGGANIDHRYEGEDVTPGHLSSSGDIPYSLAIEEPFWVHFTFAGDITDVTPFFSHLGRLRKYHITPTDFPCIPGQSFHTARKLVPALAFTEDLPDGDARVGQIFLNPGNGSEFEMEAIGGDGVFSGGVWDMLDGEMRCIYKALDRSVITRGALSGSLTVGTVIDARTGGVTATTSVNGDYFSLLSGLTNADADDEYTFFYDPPVSSAGGIFGLWFYLDGGAGNRYTLEPDGTWKSVANQTQGANLMDASGTMRHPVKVSFALPNAATFGAATCELKAYMRAFGTSDPINHRGAVIAPGKAAVM